MVSIGLFRVLISFNLYIFTLQVPVEKFDLEKFSMDKICGNDFLILDGDRRPGIGLQLTSSSKYKPNFNCTIKFRASLPSQRLIITIEKMDVTDCPNDLLHIYDDKKLVNEDINQQCGTWKTYSFTSTTTQVTMTFTSNSAKESSGFQAAVALHFTAIPACPRMMGVYQCKNKNCISKELECDGRNHCGDFTDENQCSIIG